MKRALAGLGALALLLCSCDTTPVAFTPDGSRFAAVVYNREKGGQRVMELWVGEVASGKSKLVHSAEAVGPPAWSPTGKTLHYLTGGRNMSADLGPGGLSMKHTFKLQAWDGTRAREKGDVSFGMGSEGLAFSAPCVSRDGQWLYCCDWEGDDPAAVRRSLVKKDREVIRKRSCAIALAPAGDRIALLDVGYEESCDLAVMALKDVSPKNLVEGLGSPRVLAAFPPAWSPDGKRIAYVAEAPGSKDGSRAFEVWLVEVATKAKARVSEAGVSSCLPMWTRDGKSLLFSTVDPAAGRYGVRRAAPGSGTSEPVPGTEGAVGCGLSPDSRTLALRVMLLEPPAEAGERECNFVRLLELPTGKSRDFVFNALQHLCSAHTDLMEAVALAKAEKRDEAAARARRGLATLDALARRFPQDARADQAQAMRRRLENLSQG